MKWTALYHLSVLMATVAALPEPQPISYPESEPVVADPGFQGDLADRDLFDASGLHLKTDLEKRNQIQKRNGWLHCGNLPDGDRPNSLRLLNELKGSGTQYTINGGTCLRVKCWNTTGIYVCNDQRNGVTVSGQAIWERGWIIANRCCLGGIAGTWNPQINGQQFTDAQGGYNVLIGYANCNHWAGRKPSTYGNGGKCKRTDQWIG